MVARRKHTDEDKLLSLSLSLSLSLGLTFFAYDTIITCNVTLDEIIFADWREAAIIIVEKITVTRNTLALRASTLIKNFVCTGPGNKTLRHHIASSSHRVIF